MSDDKYNGWSNRETWAVVLWLQNDEVNYNRAKEAATLPAPESLERLQALVESMCWYDTSERPDNSLFNPLMAKDCGSLWRVDWHEVRNAFVGD